MEKIPEELRVSKSLSNTSVRKSFNADEYMQNLKLKLGKGDYNMKNLEISDISNFAQFIQKEKEYLKNQSNLKSNVNTKNEFETIHNQHMRSFTNPNVSVNIYETISANLNKESTNSQNNFFQNPQTANANSNIPFSNTNSAANLNINENNNKFIGNKDDFKSFSKDPKEEIAEKKDNNMNINNHNNHSNTINKLPEQIKTTSHNNMFTSSQLQGNMNTNIFTSKSPTNTNPTIFSNFQALDTNKNKKDIKSN